MKRARIAATVLATVSAALWSAGVGTAAESQSLKQMMGENFAGLQRILVSLVLAEYSQVPEQVKLIEDHAEELTQRVPENAESDRDRYVSYAYNLKVHANDLRTIVQVLQEHDAGKEQLATDGLREAAAAHYGSMVTMCVACHNRFRPQAVR